MVEQTYNIESEIAKAKQYLKKQSTKGTNLHDQLCGLLGKVLTERPLDSADLAESYLRDCQVNIITPTAVKEVVDNNEVVKYAENQLKLFEKGDEEFGGGEGGAGGDGDEEYEVPLPNIMQQAHYFEQASVGLGRDQTFRIFLALKQLVFTHPLSSVRFWGKVFGTQANYIIAECEYREGEGEDEETLEDEDELQENADEETGLGEGEENENEPPKSTWQQPPVLPKEVHRSGANKKVFFVCNTPGETWVKLPHVLPSEIVAARKITKLFTGNLQAEIDCYPPFSGTEANYLRAQIARISASTQISPAGVFTFDEEEDEDEEEEARETYIVNLDFEGVPLADLADPSMTSWVHHTQFILPQGRCMWHNPNTKSEEDFEEEDEEEEEGQGEVQPEVGLTLLSPVADDTNVSGHPAWTVSVSSASIPQYACAVARSNLWPGAVAIARKKMFENIYVGFGQKYIADCYSPPVPPAAEEEYPVGPAVCEQNDPTIEEERAIEEARKEQDKPEDGMDNDDDDDDDD